MPSMTASFPLPYRPRYKTSVATPNTPASSTTTQNAELEMPTSPRMLLMLPQDGGRNMECPLPPHDSSIGVPWRWTQRARTTTTVTEAQVGKKLIYAVQIIVNSLFTNTYDHLLQFPRSPGTIIGRHILLCPLPSRTRKVSIIMLRFTFANTYLSVQNGAQVILTSVKWDQRWRSSGLTRKEDMSPTGCPSIPMELPEHSTRRF